MCVYIYSIYRSLPRVTEKFCRRSLASPPLLTVLSLSRASILIESRGTDALLRRSARHRHTQPRVPENDAMERTTAVESVVAQRERVWERERESWVGEQEGRRWEWEGGCERGRKVGSGGRVRDSGRANVLSETRDPERESVYRAFREHERRSEERGGGDGLSLIVPTAAHEPLKVPYKYGPVNVRRPPLFSLSLSLSLSFSLSSACGRVCTWWSRSPHTHWLTLTSTHVRTRACVFHRRRWGRHTATESRAERRAVEKARSVVRRNDRSRKKRDDRRPQATEKDARAFACLPACLPCLYVAVFSLEIAGMVSGAQGRTSHGRCERDEIPESRVWVFWRTLFLFFWGILSFLFFSFFE